MPVGGVGEKHRFLLKPTLAELVQPRETAVPSYPALSRGDNGEQECTWFATFTLPSPPVVVDLDAPPA